MTPLNALGGNDSLFPGLGDDAVNGGRGGDTVFFFASAPIGVAADLRTGIVTGGQGNDTLTGVECLNGFRARRSLHWRCACELLRRPRGR
jgi:Ca2+-binding RTX toxin-like protein